MIHMKQSYPFEGMSFKQMQEYHLYQCLFGYNEIFDRLRKRIGDEAFRRDVAELAEQLHWYDEDSEAFDSAWARYKIKLGPIYDKDFIECLIFYYESYFNLLPEENEIEGWLNDAEAGAENL